MKIFSAFLAVLATGSTLVAASNHDSRALTSRHSRIAQRELPKRDVAKRCRQRKPANNTDTDAAKEVQAQKDQAAQKAQQEKEQQAKAQQEKDQKAADDKKNQNDNKQTLSSSAPSGSCGNSGATKETTKTSGPNGNIDYFNCGINAGGWTPPVITVNDIVTADLGSAAKSNGSPFKACSQFIGLFEKYAGQHNIPAIMIASFAMQESSCNPNTVGGAGEQGLMQLTHEKCGGAPGGNCRDPEFNIATGTRYFADTLKNNGGNLLVSIGQYNGWFPKMTFAQATAAGNTGCCRCQNNLDYLHQFLNGWCQNINAYDNNNRLGKYFNLDKCN